MFLFLPCYSLETGNIRLAGRRIILAKMWTVWPDAEINRSLRTSCGGVELTQRSTVVSEPLVVVWK